MKRDVTVISLRQFESAGGLAEGYSFEDFSCPLNEEVQDFLQKKAVHSLHLGRCLECFGGVASGSGRENACSIRQGYARCRGGEDV